MSGHERVATVFRLVVYMTTLPVADARTQLSRLVDEAERTHELFEITRNGHRAAVLLAPTITTRCGRRSWCSRIPIWRRTSPAGPSSRAGMSSMLVGRY